MVVFNKGEKLFLALLIQGICYDWNTSVMNEVYS